MSEKSNQTKSNKSSLSAESQNKSSGKFRPPVVCFLGHVDHGKTSLLDCIRNTKVQAGESGGITQSIGAYHVGDITFIDTPGHEAFTAMRAQGGQTADLAVLVVAANDGVQPQTIEAINHIKASNIPMIVVFNKIDLPNINLDQVKKDLASQDVLVEDWGGKTVSVSCSAKTGEGIDDLMAMIHLVAEMEEITGDPKAPTSGVIIESYIDNHRGPMATVIVKQGSLSVKDILVAGQTYGKIKSLWDWQGKKIKKAGPGFPAEVMGLKDTTPAGTTFSTVKKEKEAETICEERKKEQEISQKPQQRIMQSLTPEKKKINLVIKADTKGSLEAINYSLGKINQEQVSLNVLHQGIGDISEADTLLAQTSNGIILGFRVNTGSIARKIIEQHKIKSRTYDIIYHLIEDLENFILGKGKEGEFERIGLAEILKVFKLTSGNLIAGCRITEGEMKHKGHVRIIRDDEITAEGRITSLKQNKERKKSISAGNECGILLKPEFAFQEGDFIELIEENQEKTQF